MNSEVEHRTYSPLQFQTFDSLDESSPRPSFSNFPSTISPYITSNRSPFSTSLTSACTPAETVDWNYFNSSFDNDYNRPIQILNPPIYGLLYGAPSDPATTSQIIHSHNSNQQPPQGLDLFGWSANSEEARSLPPMWRLSTSQEPAMLLDPTNKDPQALSNLASYSGSHIVSRRYLNTTELTGLEGTRLVNTDNSHRAESFPRKSHSPKLRTADLSRHFAFATQPKLSSNRTKSTRRDRAPTNQHNEIEKQYRTRLNHHFAQLLARIPRESIIASGFESGAGRAVSKAETLVLAEQYIKKLEEEELVLRGENRELQTDFEGIKEEWVRQGGVLFP